MRLFKDIELQLKTEVIIPDADFFAGDSHSYGQEIYKIWGAKIIF